MTAFVLPLAVFLAAVFAASAIGKLRASDRGLGAFSALQIRVRRPQIAAALLITAEALVAVALLATSGWMFVAASAAALALTAGLLLVTIRAHRLGATDDCGCFGDWMPAAIGPRLIARNIVLVVVAAALVVAAAVAAAGGAPLGLPAALAGGRPAVGIAIGALGAGLLIAAGTAAIVRASRGDAPVTAPPARGAGAVLLPASDEVIDLLAATARARLLVFVSPGCRACADVLASLGAAEGPLSALVDVYAVQRVSNASGALQPAHALPRTTRFAVDVGGSLSTILGTGRATPVAALIGTDGAQAGPLAVGTDEVDELIRSLLALADQPS
ncbi:MauE/DoxX family redox-associated membrane protein [Microbacterium sufflavum]|uniref:Methylamine utilisation protein MauE domain-containing protein n=1 Tax=Microbacterium sufflavum TaxID=2851649 RepID=A0ABY4IH47_9MICO|nr:MauE/DoxX family redox-associated membrane protein [Microbacterium sufflavum]MCK2026505.1 hypothetical protein [Microbacterium sufflavum]UPL11301.1 hypothetical protein KV394_09320 [Microbacterium sufflavum]